MIVTEFSDQAYVGTALTLRLTGGFALTVATIWLIPVFEDTFGWRWAFAFLALGPVLGLAAMPRPKSLPNVLGLVWGVAVIGHLCCFDADLMRVAWMIEMEEGQP